MIATYIHHGQSIDYTPSTAKSAGDVVVANDIVGVVVNDIAANTLGALAVEGVFAFPKATGAGTDFDLGEKAYWDATAVQAENATSSDNKLMGKCVRAAATTDTHVWVRLQP